jgi:pimeloyl-ACP methyl ester carboxylesterase
LAADDAAAILKALQVRKVDVYGDSYGTFAAQVFAGRHPGMVRTIVLDGAYSALSRDGWYSAGVPGMRNAFNLVCNRSPDCSGSSLDRISRVLAKLRANPKNAPAVMRGKASGPMTPADIAFVMNTAGSDRIVFAELDPAARAFLAGDPVPLARLVNEAYANEEGAVSAPPSIYSMGMFAANSCSDNPTIFDRTLPPARRQASYQAAVAHKKQTDPRVYDPFTIDEWLRTPLDWGQVPLCLNWPVPSAAHPPGDPIPSGRMPNVPALVLTGDLDTITPVGEGDQAAGEFQQVTRVIVPNGGHVVAQGDANDSGCLSWIVSTFIKNDGKTDTTCATTAIAPVRLVPDFSTALAGVSLRGVSGSARAAGLRVARAALLTAADSFARFYTLGLKSGPGLRGGTFKANKAGTGITLINDKWVRDLAVSGSVMRNASSGVMTAYLKLSAGATGWLTAMWIPSGPQGSAAVLGSVNGSQINITMPAP